MSQDPALEPPRIMLSPGPEYADENRRFQGIPGIAGAAGGRLWATWYAGGVWESWENYVVLVTSGDEGKTWSKPVMVIDAPGTVRTFDPCLWLDPQNRLWFFWAQSMCAKEPDHYFMDGRFGVWCMVTENPDDENPTWSQPRRIGDGIMMNKPIVKRNGDWILPISIWRLMPDRKELGPPLYHWMEKETGAYAVISRDSGKTFEYLGKADQQEERGFDEHMFIEKNDNSLWMLTRVRDGIWENLSTDGGLTWDKGHFSDIPHEGSRFFIQRLASGNILLVRHDPPDRTKRNRTHLAAFLSKDDGKTWEGRLLLDEREQVSYPDGFQAADGTIRVIYDYHRRTDKLILMAVFREEDILAGDWISPGAQKEVFVNQATGLNEVPPA
jgi:hypothetical protein